MAIEYSFCRRHPGCSSRLVAIEISDTHTEGVLGGIKYVRDLSFTWIANAVASCAAISWETEMFAARASGIRYAEHVPVATR